MDEKRCFPGALKRGQNSWYLGLAGALDGISSLGGLLFRSLLLLLQPEIKEHTFSRSQCQTRAQQQKLFQKPRGFNHDPTSYLLTSPYTRFHQKTGEFVCILLALTCSPFGQYVESKAQKPSRWPVLSNPAHRKTCDDLNFFFFFFFFLNSLIFL